MIILLWFLIYDYCFGFYVVGQGGSGSGRYSDRGGYGDRSGGGYK